VLGNAVAHSPANAPVNVFISDERDDGTASARIDIIDEGPGIPESVLPHIFEQFFTGRKQRGGIGLGLLIARRIATAHGGDVIADNEPGKGARFTIRLPALVDPR